MRIVLVQLPKKVVCYTTSQKYKKKLLHFLGIFFVTKFGGLDYAERSLREESKIFFFRSKLFCNRRIYFRFSKIRFPNECEGISYDYAWIMQLVGFSFV